MPDGWVAALLGVPGLSAGALAVGRVVDMLATWWTLRAFFGSRSDSIDVAWPLVQETVPPLTTVQVDRVTLTVVEA
jgi:hypothetical protein